MTLISGGTREAVVRRARGRCEYCLLGQETQVATFPVDHVVPVSAGGATALENLALGCPRCNAAKWKHTSGVDPDSGGTVALFNPRIDAWGEHFAWSGNDNRCLEGRTPVGRATVVALELNHPRHLSVRGWLVTLGQHPPA